jgi:hypothetical protein
MPSPKFQFHVFAPIDSSKKDFLNLSEQLVVTANLDIGGLIYTASCSTNVSEQVLLKVISVTEKLPVSEKLWDGFWKVEVSPSPNFHSHSSTFPILLSSNTTDL